MLERHKNVPKASDNSDIHVSSTSVGQGDTPGPPSSWQSFFDQKKLAWEFFASLVALIGAIFWFLAEPGWEPLLVICGASAFSLYAIFKLIQEKFNFSKSVEIAVNCIILIVHFLVFLSFYLSHVRPLGTVSPVSTVSPTATVASTLLPTSTSSPTSALPTATSTTASQTYATKGDTPSGAILAVGETWIHGYTELTLADEGSIQGRPEYRVATFVLTNRSTFYVEANYSLGSFSIRDNLNQQLQAGVIITDVLQTYCSRGSELVGFNESVNLIFNQLSHCDPLPAHTFAFKIDPDNVAQDEAIISVHGIAGITTANWRVRLRQLPTATPIPPTLTPTLAPTIQLPSPTNTNMSTKVSVDTPTPTNPTTDTTDTTPGTILEVGQPWNAGNFQLILVAAEYTAYTQRGSAVEASGFIKFDLRAIAQEPMTLTYSLSNFSVETKPSIPMQRDVGALRRTQFDPVEPSSGEQQYVEYNCRSQTLPLKKAIQTELRFYQCGTYLQPSGLGGSVGDEGSPAVEIYLGTEDILFKVSNLGPVDEAVWRILNR